MNSYTGHFWLSFLSWVFIVPIVLFMFFWSSHNFGPEHCKQLLFDILTNPIPEIELEDRDGESNDLNSFRQCCFNHNLVARCITRNKHLLAKRVTRSSTVIVHDCPLSNINESALKLQGYYTYATFHNTSMAQEVSASDQSMPMTLHFAILEFSCPDIVFLSLPRCPPDGLITSSLVLILISSIITINMTCICIQLSLQQMKCIQVTQSALRELFHTVLREAPTRFYLIRREHLHCVSNIVSFSATNTQLIGLTKIPSLLMTQIYATVISSFDTDSSFWVCDNSATGHICNGESLFSGELVPSINIVGAATGSSKLTLAGTVIMIVPSIYSC
jgi:hypothetical protein